ncbi:HAD-IA family hydrolase [Acinetobacter sp.]|uniref:HAD-IA family hydrolase n=1 Tax=Acinetobacter sp. TaxID=472 RepID=UPI0035B496E1
MVKPIVIFDMDGTLLDLAYDDLIWNQLLPIRYAETHQCTLEQSQATLFEFYQQHSHTLNWYSSRFWSAKVGVDVLALQQEHQHKVSLRGGCIELLEYLKANKYPCWLATNADCASLKFKLEQTGIAEYFDVIVSSETLGHAKEFPAFWEKLHQQHPFNISQAYFIDDTEKVLLGAQKFGLQHLISIQQPSSIGLVRDESPFPMLKHLTDFIPLLEQAEEHKQYA